MRWSRKRLCPVHPCDKIRLVLAVLLSILIASCGGGGGGGGSNAPSSVCGDGVCSADENCSACAQDCGECPDIGSMDAAGDSITKAFDADPNDCAYDDQEWLNWATSDTHGTNLCSDGGDGVFSHAEMIECFNGGNIEVAFPNAAMSGACLLYTSDAADE